MVICSYPYAISIRVDSLKGRAPICRVVGVPKVVCRPCRHHMWILSDPVRLNIYAATVLSAAVGDVVAAAIKALEMQRSQLLMMLNR